MVRHGSTDPKVRAVSLSKRKDTMTRPLGRAKHSLDMKMFDGIKGWKCQGQRQTLFGAQLCPRTGTVGRQKPCRRPGGAQTAPNPAPKRMSGCPQAWFGLWVRSQQSPKVLNALADQQSSQPHADGGPQTAHDGQGRCPDRHKVQSIGPMMASLDGQRLAAKATVKVRLTPRIGQWACGAAARAAKTATITHHPDLPTAFFKTTTVQTSHKALPEKSSAQDWQTPQPASSCRQSLRCV